MAFGLKVKVSDKAKATSPDQCEPMSVLAFRDTMDKAIAAVAINAPISESLFPKKLLERPEYRDKTAQRVLATAYVTLKDVDLALNFFWRFRAMQTVMLEPEIKDYMPESNGKVAAFHPAVFEAVATFPMQSDGRFKKDAFFERIAALAIEIDGVQNAEPAEEETPTAA